ncbi:hypothetical protein PSE_4591 [Pseudovibrio sp. FO-BEG1]|nr:hypothetical protein PSE_4591 [Pseudovibrio sp. FO-BEG1]
MSLAGFTSFRAAKVWVPSPKDAKLLSGAAMRALILSLGVLASGKFNRAKRSDSSCVNRTLSEMDLDGMLHLCITNVFLM